MAESVGSGPPKDNDDKDTHESLRQRIISKRPSDNHQCTICLNSIHDLSFADCCLHPFCRSCIIEWSKRSNQCPVCRTVFNNVLTNIQPDSNYESIPIEPPPELDGAVPFINIIRDIMFSPDGLTTVVRTRIINEEGTTEITEARGAGRQSSITPVGSHPSITGRRRSVVQSPGSPTHPPPMVPGHNGRASVEMDEVDRFMGLLFRSLLSPEPLSPVSFIEDPAEARITRLSRSQVNSPNINGHPPQTPPSLLRPPPLIPPFLPTSRQHRPPLMFPGKRMPKYQIIPGLNNWPKHTFKTVQQDSLTQVKTLPAKISSTHLSSLQSPMAKSIYTTPSTPPLPQTKARTSIETSVRSSSLKSIPSYSKSSDEELQLNRLQRRRARRREIFGRNLSKSKDESPKDKKPSNKHKD